MWQSCHDTNTLARSMNKCTTCFYNQNYTFRPGDHLSEVGSPTIGILAWFLHGLKQIRHYSIVSL